MNTHTRCIACGAAHSLHRADDLACPLDGREAPVGREQRWSLSRYLPDLSEEVERLKKELAHSILDNTASLIEGKAKLIDEVRALRAQVAAADSLLSTLRSDIKTGQDLTPFIKKIQDYFTAFNASH